MTNPNKLSPERLSKIEAAWGNIQGEDPFHSISLTIIALLGHIAYLEKQNEELLEEKTKGKPLTADGLFDAISKSVGTLR